MNVLDRIRGGLVVSCQPVDDGPMDSPQIVSAMALAAVAGGAAAVRIEGVDNLSAARPRVDVPIIGIVKRDLPDSPVRITPSIAEAEALIRAGADIVAYDGTARPRSDPRDAILAAIVGGGALAMADCATLADAQAALAGGAAIIGTTLSGYTAETSDKGDEPDLDLIRAFRAIGGFVMAEGRYDTPGLAAEAMRAGADAVTVGSALTRLEIMTGRFVQAVRAAS